MSSLSSFTVSSRELILGAGALVTGFLLGFGYLHSQLPRKSASSSSSSSSSSSGGGSCPFALTTPRKVFVLTVTLKLDPSKPNAVQQFLDRWAILADYCCKHEPHTLSYEALRSKEDPNTIYIYERYVTESDLTVVHHGSQAFKDFGAWLSASGLVLEKTRATYEETNVGYMTH